MNGCISWSPVLLSASLVFLAGTACGSNPASGGDGAGGARPAADPPPAGWSDALALNVAVDLNPDPHILEVNLDARPASIDFGFTNPTSVFTYNGSVPGPLLHAARGDTLIVHFTNHLPDETSIHWHGVRVPAAMDGTPDAQPPTPAGGAFEYRFELPDAGLFWYHPHFRTTEQVAAGLYGAILVDDDASPPADFGPEMVLVLSDMDIRPDGTLAPYDPTDVLTMVFGRTGSVLLVNGRRDPTLLARPGQRQRWHVVNAATTRYLRLGIAGQQLVRIGGDGGLREAPLDGADFMLAPSERADLLVVPDAALPPATELAVQRLPYDRGYLQDTQPAETLFYLQLVGAPAVKVPAPLPAVLRTIEAVDLSRATTKSVVIAEGMSDQGSFSFLVNGEPFAGGHTGAMEAHVGDNDVWSIENQTPSDHPIHLHGFFFQVIDPTTGLPGSPREWKDTVNVPQHSRLSFAVHYDDRPGMWMYHCHILDHAELGLMGMLHLMP
ncbi:MAG: multicopper oxidase family protein [Polyangia bacterium]